MFHVYVFENISICLTEHIVQTLLGWGNNDSWLKFAHTHMIRAILAYQSERRFASIEP